MSQSDKNSNTPKSPTHDKFSPFGAITRENARPDGFDSHLDVLFGSDRMILGKVVEPLVNAERLTKQADMF